MEVDAPALVAGMTRYGEMRVAVGLSVPDFAALNPGYACYIGVNCEGHQMSKNDPALIAPPSGKFTEAQMAKWPQYSGVRRVALSALEFEDQFLFVRSLYEADAR